MYTFQKFPKAECFNTGQNLSAKKIEKDKKTEGTGIKCEKLLHA